MSDLIFGIIALLYMIFCLYTFKKSPNIWMYQTNKEESSISSHDMTNSEELPEVIGYTLTAKEIKERELSRLPEMYKHKYRKNLYYSTGSSQNVR